MINCTMVISYPSRLECNSVVVARQIKNPDILGSIRGSVYMGSPNLQIFWGQKTHTISGCGYIHRAKPYA